MFNMHPVWGLLWTPPPSAKNLVQVSKYGEEVHGNLDEAVRSLIANTMTEITKKYPTFKEKLVNKISELEKREEELEHTLNLLLKMAIG